MTIRIHSRFTRPGCFFIVVAPFCSCPASLVSGKFFAVGPGCAKCFFFVALRWAPRPFGGARAKKNTTQGVFFWLRPRGKAREGEAPLGAGTGPEQKKNTTQGVFFLLRPRRKAREGEAPLEAGTGPEQKKTPPRVFFFAPAPGKGRGRRSPVGRRHGARAKSFFFCSGPVPAPNGASPSLAFPRGRSKKKKHPGWCFFFALAPCRRPTGLLLPLPFAGAAAKKKNTLGGVFFFLLRPRADAHSLTAGLGGDASPSPGWCDFFCCGPARTGVVFFFLLWPRPDAHSLTVGRFRQGPGGVFFLAAAPPGLFRQ